MTDKDVLWTTRENGIAFFPTYIKEVSESRLNKLNEKNEKKVITQEKILLKINIAA